MQKKADHEVENFMNSFEKQLSSNTSLMHEVVEISQLRLWVACLLTVIPLNPNPFLNQSESFELYSFAICLFELWILAENVFGNLYELWGISKKEISNYAGTTVFCSELKQRCSCKAYRVAGNSNQCFLSSVTTVTHCCQSFCRKMWGMKKGAHLWPAPCRLSFIRLTMTFHSAITYFSCLFFSPCVWKGKKGTASCHCKGPSLSGADW